jgi:5' nucleotidase, deoxy (Pyrimidine), cytosolic type C protein (NT5C)
VIIYLDMDDVVADWHAAAQDFLKMRWHKEAERIPQEDWDRIKMNSRFYYELPLREHAEEIVQYCRDLLAAGKIEGLYFLTALPRNNDMQWAVYDKVLWAQENFPGIPVFIGPYSNDKWRHCRPGDILIDDRTSNCMEWANAGGLSHIYKTWEPCKQWLDDLFNHGNIRDK